MDHALSHGQRALANVDGQQQFALGGHGDPHPIGRAVKTLARFACADLTVLHGTEQRIEFVQLHLGHADIVEEVL